MRTLRVQECRQLTRSHMAHLAHAVVGATRPKEVFGQIFVEVHDIFMTQPQ